jgi:hypothetical protein
MPVGGGHLRSSTQDWLELPPTRVGACWRGCRVPCPCTSHSEENASWRPARRLARHRGGHAEPAALEYQYTSRGEEQESTRPHTHIAHPLRGLCCVCGRCGPAHMLHTSHNVRSVQFVRWVSDRRRFGADVAPPWPAHTQPAGLLGTCSASTSASLAASLPNHHPSGLFLWWFCIFFKNHENSY